jgi:mitochondrial chaperone BCS1
MTFFVDILENPYFSAGAGLIGLGTLGATFRQVVLRYSYLVQRQFFVSLEVCSRDKAYPMLLSWLSEKTATRSHHLSVQSLHAARDICGSPTTSSFRFVPCPGIHYVRWRHRYFKVERNREKASVSMDLSSAGLGAQPFETLTLTTLGRSPSIFETVLEEAQELSVAKQEGRTIIYTGWANEWRPFGQPHRKRPLSSVILAQSIAESIFKDIEEFIVNGKWYYDRGLPIIYYFRMTSASSFT